MSESQEKRQNLPLDRDAYEGLAEMAKALANPLRLELIECLAQSPRAVEVIARVCALPVKTVSHHLQIMKAAGLVKRKSRGREAIYSLADAAVARIWIQLRLLAEKQGLIRNLPSVPQGLTTSEFQAMLKNSRPTIIDVRPEEEFATAHIPGAVSIPLDELDDRIGELPKKHPVVAVCRGPHCRMANWAVGILRDQGFDARRYEEGMLVWLAAGNEIKKS